MTSDDGLNMATSGNAPPNRPLKNGTGSEPDGAKLVKDHVHEVPVPIFQQAARPPAGGTIHAAAPNGKLIEYEAFIESQLTKTRSHVWSVELVGDLMVLAAGTLGYFFLAGIVDHWVIPGGLGFWGRLLFLLGYVAVALYLARQALPLLVRRINPLYAAHTIERSRPSLKNALVNFLIFRENPGRLTSAVYQAIEEQAATKLAKVEVETAVDRSKLIRIGYALVAIVVVCAIYTVVSPKDLFRSAGRVLMPWARIDAPTRTRIVDIEPGDARAFRGQQVTVKARVEGLGGEGKVTLTYSTDDGQTVNRAVEMSLPPDGYKHVGVLPAGDASLQQGLTYRIEAGDAVTMPHRIEVVAAPTIVVRSVEYKYPSYTGLLAQRVEHQGDIKAIEGTEITLRAVANEPIQAAHVDFDCDNKLDQRMKSQEDQAEATFHLSLKEDRQTPTHDSYQLIFKNEAEQQNPQPVRHQIEVTRDLAPEIQFVGPKKDEIDVPLNAAVDLEIVANDPDFALRTVKLSATSGKQPLLEKVLLDEAWRGQFVKKFRFEPRKLGLKAGDVVAYSAVAEDNKDPQPNRTTTVSRKIRIVSPDNRPANQDQVAQGEKPDDRDEQPGSDAQGRDDEHPRDDDARPDAHAQKHDSQNADKRDDAASDASNDKQPQEDQSEQGSDPKASQQASKSGDTGQEGKSQASQDGGKSQAQDDKSGQAGADEGAASDGSNDGDAFERILNHRNEQRKSQPDSQQHAQQRQDNKQPTDDQPRGDDAQNGKGQGKQDQQAQPPDKSQPGKGQSDENRGDGKGAGEKGAGEKGAGEKGAGQQAGDDRSGEKSRPQDADGGAGDKSQGRQGTKSSGEGKKPQRDQQPSTSQHDTQPGKADRREKPSDKESSQGREQGKAGDNRPDADSAQKGAKGQGRPTNPQAGDEQAGDNGAQQRQGPANGKGKPTDESVGTEEPQTTDDNQSQRGQPQPTGKKSTAKPDPAGAERGEKQGGRGQDDGPRAKPGNSPGDKAAERRADRDQRNTEAPDKAAPDATEPDDQSRPDEGAQAKENPKSQRQQDASRGKENPDGKVANDEKQKGPAGPGQSSQENKGSPSPQGKNQPRDKSPGQSPDGKNQKPDAAAQSPSTSERESNSEGQDDGDRSGGGKKGGGQKANKSGTGGAGQNTPSDEGAGKSDEAGTGETSDRAGTDRQADGKTGQSGSKQGAGSRDAAVDGGQSKPGGDTPGSNNATAQQPGQPGGDKSGSQGANNPSGGKPGQNAAADQTFRPSAEKADKANLDYARKATDLALTHLKDELKKAKPDPELLDRLGWTRTDLENFVKRWEQMRAQAQAPGEKGASARRELDETLRSLGLRPRATSLKSNSARDDKSQGYKESRRTSPPAEYAEQYKAYTQGTARGGK